MVSIVIADARYPSALLCVARLQQDTRPPVPRYGVPLDFIHHKRFLMQRNVRWCAYFLLCVNAVGTIVKTDVTLKYLQTYERMCFTSLRK